LDTDRGKGIFGDLGLVEMLIDNVMDWTQKIKIPVAFRSLKYKSFLRCTKSADGTNMSVRVTIL